MATIRICSVPECGKPVKSGNYCPMHARRLWRKGTLELTRAPRGLCTIEGCDKPHVANGHCRMHYSRLYSRGKLHVRVTRIERVRNFVEEFASTHTTNECVRGPEGFNPDGYSYLSVGGYTTHVYRHLCELRHGPAPELGYQAAHDCGNAWCWHLDHIVWKTTLDNHADKKRHGTHLKGESMPWSKITEQQVREIREMSKSMSQREIARRLGIGHNHVWHILHDTWKHVK
jgi:hypothetical protein